MIETGIKVSPLVFKTRNIIIELDAVSFFLFNVCNCSMAFSPNGVAALSKPSMLAATFMKILPVAGCPFGMSGKRRVNTGLSNRAKALTTPPFSPIFITPIHKVNTPVRPNEISNAVFEVENVESIMAGKTDTSPQNISFAKAITKAITKNAIQI